MPDIPTPKDLAEQQGTEGDKPTEPADDQQPDPTDTVTTTATGDKPGDGDGDTDTLEGWKTQSRKHEKRARENYAQLQEAQARIAELEGTKAEEKKQAEEAAAAQKLREDIANDKGVPAHLLQGDSQESLEEQAEALLIFVGQNRAPTGPVVPEAGTGTTQTRDSEADAALKAMGFG